MGGEVFEGSLVDAAHGRLFVRQPAGAPHRDGREGREAALFVHGLGGESIEFADVACALADRVDWYALDLPGFGESPPPSDQDLTIDAHARAVVDVIEVIGRGAVHLVGNSMGGAVATRVAAEHPALVRSLTLISPALPDLRPRLWSSQLLVALIPWLGNRLMRMALLGDPQRLARQAVFFCYGNPRAVDGERLAEEIAAVRRRAALPHCVPVYQASFRGLMSAYFQRGPRSLWRQAEQIAVPTLLLYGGRDKLVDPRMARRAERTFPNARVVMMPDAGHVAHLEFPDRVAALLRGFFDEERGRTLDAGMAGRRGTVEGSDGAFG